MGSPKAHEGFVWHLRCVITLATPTQTICLAGNVRYELIDGMAYLMAPAPALEHQDIAGEIYSNFGAP